MILYLTSNRQKVVENGKAVVPCPAVICRAYGYSASHLCFATEPLTGMGEWVHQIDVPVATVEKFEYKNEFRTEEKARYFAIPAELVRTLPIVTSRYEEITGNKWNTWTIPVLDRRGHAATELLGKWSIVWQSRDGIFSARVGRKSPDGKFLSIEVTATAEFNPERDYLIVETHEEYAREGGGIKETWHLKTQAGVTPQWVIFPALWQSWVWNKEVRASAIEYLRSCVPEAAHDIDFALRMESKANVARAWRDAADRINSVLSRKLGTRIDLGYFASHSWTAVQAMPLRIATRLSQNLPYQPWQPPITQPEFQHPNASGRVILANLYGAYPKKGPGVEHDPQDRPYTGQEGELKDSFNSRQSVAASVLAGI